MRDNYTVFQLKTQQNNQHATRTHRLTFLTFNEISIWTWIMIRLMSYYYFRMYTSTQPVKRIKQQHHEQQQQRIHRWDLRDMMKLNVNQLYDAMCCIYKYWILQKFSFQQWWNTRHFMECLLNWFDVRCLTVRQLWASIVYSLFSIQLAFACVVLCFFSCVPVALLKFSIQPHLYIWMLCVCYVYFVYSLIRI